MPTRKNLPTRKKLKPKRLSLILRNGIGCGNGGWCRPNTGLCGQKAGESKAELHARAGKKAALSAAAHELIHYLNAKTGRDYRLVASNVRLVQARLREGATVEQVKAVIDAKVRQWGPDPTMAEYLRPATLFGAMKFEQYLGQLNGRGPAASRLVHDARCVN